MSSSFVPPRVYLKVRKKRSSVPAECQRGYILIMNTAISASRSSRLAAMGRRFASSVGPHPVTPIYHLPNPIICSLGLSGPQTNCLVNEHVTFHNVQDCQVVIDPDPTAIPVHGRNLRIRFLPLTPSYKKPTTSVQVGQSP